MGLVGGPGCRSSARSGGLAERIGQKGSKPLVCQFPPQKNIYLKSRNSRELEFLDSPTDASENRGTQIKSERALHSAVQCTLRPWSERLSRTSQLSFRLQFCLFNRCQLTCHEKHNTYTRGGHLSPTSPHSTPKGRMELRPELQVAQLFEVPWKPTGMDRKFVSQSSHSLGVSQNRGHQQRAVKPALHLAKKTHPDCFMNAMARYKAPLANTSCPWP